ncbi:hypothetical protein J6590_028897 [Homalodisca vitripennis]|nr:hypothetical protein J6590_028897 [Homalodisca vitripennis]
MVPMALDGYNTDTNRARVVTIQCERHIVLDTLLLVFFRDLLGLLLFLMFVNDICLSDQCMSFVYHIKLIPRKCNLEATLLRLAPFVGRLFERNHLNLDEDKPRHLLCSLNRLGCHRRGSEGEAVGNLAELKDEPEL